jgi:lysozyme
VNIGRKGEELIKEFESCELTAYRDQRGVVTCGWGATGPDISMRTHWTQDQADARFDRDIEVRAKQLTEFLDGAPTTQNQFDALLSLGYNIGMGALKGSTALRKHIAGDHNGAAKAILMWNKVNGKQNPGLTRRRNAEHDLYLSED